MMSDCTQDFSISMCGSKAQLVLHAENADTNPSKQKGALLLWSLCSTCSFVVQEKEVRST